MFKKFNPAKTIGLVRYLDGTYRPSNSRSFVKFEALLKKAHVILSGGQVNKYTLPFIRALARQHGYTIMTARKSL